MPKFKNKVIRKADGGKYYPGGDEGPGNYNMAESLRGLFAEGLNQPLSERMSKLNKYNERKTGPVDELRKIRSSAYSPGMMREGIGGKPIQIAPPPSSRFSGMNLSKKALDEFSRGSNLPTAMAMAPAPKAVNRSATKSVNSKSPVAPVANATPADVSKLKAESGLEMYDGMNVASERKAEPGLEMYDNMNVASAGLTNAIPARTPPAVAAPNIAKAAGELPKTKSGMKKFMDEYGKFIALGALAGTGGKKGMIAAPIIAALPGILKMLQNRGKKTTGAPAGTPAKFSGYSEYDVMTAPDTPAKFPGYSEYDYMTAPEKKMAGGAIRKFKGGSMNTMKENLVPQYKKGGNMPKAMHKEMMAMMGKKYKKGGEMSKGMSQGMMDMMGKKGKATGDMPEHKKMDMGMPIGKMPDSKKMGMAKPKPSSMDQKFAKGGTAKYASGGMCKGYGIAKKIRPTGSMN